MKILITGGAGFLGLHLATHLHKKHTLTLNDLHHFEEPGLDKKYNLHIVDVRDRGMEKLIKGQDVIIHCAAALPLWKKEEIYSTNIEGTGNVLKLAHKHKVKRVIHISSTAVYGIPKKHPIYETDPVQGVGPYGESKIAAEELCIKYIANGLPVTIIRPKTFVGTARLGVFEILFDWVHDGKKIPVFGSGNNRYQLLDVEDLVDVISLFVRSAEFGVRRRTMNNELRTKYDGAFNIGAVKFGTVKDDLTELFTAVGSHSRVLPIPSAPLKMTLRTFEALHLSPLYKWVYETADKDSFVSIDKVMKTLNWKPKYSNAQALIKAYRWYQEHYDEVKSKTSGVTHTVGWKQGVLGIVKHFL